MFYIDFTAIVVILNWYRMGLLDKNNELDLCNQTRSYLDNLFWKWKIEHSPYSSVCNNNFFKSAYLGLHIFIMDLSRKFAMKNV